MLKKRRENLKKMLKNVVFLLLLSKICFVFAQNPGLQKIIVIDVGHGGYDTGAIGINGVKEKDIVLNIAKEIVMLNRRLLNSDFDIYLTRYRDTFVSLSDRSKLPKALKADLFVSLHGNAALVNAKGMEVYVPRIRATNSEENPKKSIALGVSMLHISSKELGIEKRGIKFANFQVLRETIAFCPALLVEVGYLSNADEASYYSKIQNTRAIALAILLAIHKHYK